MARDTDDIATPACSATSRMLGRGRELAMRSAGGRRPSWLQHVTEPHGAMVTIPAYQPIAEAALVAAWRGGASAVTEAGAERESGVSRCICNRFW